MVIWATAPFTSISAQKLRYFNRFGSHVVACGPTCMSLVLAQCTMCGLHARQPRNTAGERPEPLSKALPMTTSIDPKSLAAHVLVALASAQRARRVVTAQDLATDLDVRKADVKHVVARLHHEGHVDALRMRLSLSGLALATALGTSSLRPIRALSAAHVVAA